ncbi:MAG TPA: GPW/gp25 family protein [bacterium]|nr:GPW/gp25 family protein [bacterium]
MTPAPVSWPLLPRPDADGRLRFPSLEASVRQLIEVILLTRPGEQLMRPQYGVGLENFVHEENTLTTRGRIREAVAEGLARWERRITVDRIDVWEVPDQSTAIRVEIAYRLRRTGAVRQLNLGMPLGA